MWEFSRALKRLLFVIESIDSTIAKRLILVDFHEVSDGVYWRDGSSFASVEAI